MTVFAFVWGKRIKEEILGVTAMDCPACGQRVIADVIDVYKATHVYFIRGKYKKVASVVRCRLCVIEFDDIPTNFKIAPVTEGFNIEPTKGLIKETNPELLNTTPTPLPLHFELPQDVRRHQWAFLLAIDQHIEKETSSGGAAGNAQGLFILVGMAALFGSMLLYSRYKDSSSVPLVLLVLTVAVLFYLIYQLQDLLIFSAVHDKFRDYLIRYMVYTSDKISDLILCSKFLGSHFKKVHKYLKYVEKH